MDGAAGGQNPAVGKTEVQEAEERGEKQVP